MEQGVKTVSRAAWSGIIGFGLISIPVKLFLATESENGTGLNLLCKCHTAPVNQKRRCSVTEKVLGTDEVQKGAPVSENSYVVVTDSELDALPLPTAKTIKVEAFVSPKEVPVLEYAKGRYFIAPEK